MEGSRDKQSEAKLCRLEIDEVTITFDPPTGCEVIAEVVHRPLFGFPSDFGPDRYPTTHMIIQIFLGPPPVGLEEPVGAIPRDRHRLHVGSDRASLLGQRRSTD